VQKDKIFEILNDWNFWYKPLPNSLKREVYEEKISKYSKNGEIVVVKGVRRSGKSTLLINEIKRLLSNGIKKENILFVNFEDQRFNMFDKTSLLQDLKDVYLEYIKPDGDIYIMLDEVQNIPNWEQWVLKEYELSSNKLYVTGSNSHLLGAEFGTSLSGRILGVEVYPLSFKEYLSFFNIKIRTKADLVHNKIRLKQLFNDYIKFGAFPKIATTADEEIKKDILKSYYDTILLKDIVARYKLKNYQTLNKLSLFLLSNNSTIQAYNKLKNSFKASFDTIKDYIQYLSNSYMVLQINKFDYSYKKQLANPKKIYAIDTGLSNNVSFNISQKIGQNLENIVFLELKRRYSDIYYYKTSNNLEVDFLLKKDNFFELIQVTKTLEDEAILKRELRVFKKAKEELNKDIKATVVTLDESKRIRYDDIDIQIINILEWLLLSN